MREELFNLAKRAALKAHAPYSKLQVGAAIVTDEGRYYSGCNIENASYPEGWCAETTAIGHMIMDKSGVIAQMAVYCLQMDSITPCGGCRQRISEFATRDTMIHLCSEAGIVQSMKLGDLLPLAFEF